MSLAQRRADKRRMKLMAQIMAADIDRGKGVMALLVRGSVLMHSEAVYLG